MKKIEVTHDVMKHISEYEREGISRFLVVFIASVAVLCLLSVTGFVLIINDLLSKRAFDIFELFTQDPEIIYDFWKEAFMIFWDEIPQNLLRAVSLLIVLLICTLIITQAKRKKIKNKLKHLDKYS